ncbi:MAG: hypothetical protein K2X48_00340 [Chitinophagaceae bacterium]|nr:hypothetical protein [Chitinophagaceae bacterium]
MENNQSFETLAAHIAQDASVKNVYGEPVVTQGKTIIPVAKIVMGMGGGFGKKLRSNESETDSTKANGDGAAGSGGGGGAVATPQGVFEITEKHTRFIPANGAKYFIAGGILGALAGSLLLRRRATTADKK